MYFHSFTSMLLTLLFITLSRHMGGHIRALDYIHTMKGNLPTWVSTWHRQHLLLKISSKQDSFSNLTECLLEGCS